MIKVKYIGIFIVKLYQKILSPYWGYHCRFTPTCSNYSIEAFHKYGLITGAWKSIGRIVRCHPWSKSGHDPLL